MSVCLLAHVLFLQVTWRKLLFYSSTYEHLHYNSIGPSVCLHCSGGLNFLCEDYYIYMIYDVGLVHIDTSVLSTFSLFFLEWCIKIQFINILISGFLVDIFVTNLIKAIIWIFMLNTQKFKALIKKTFGIFRECYYL